jgi:hypothetical protein
MDELYQRRKAKLLKRIEQAEKRGDIAAVEAALRELDKQARRRTRLREEAVEASK